MISQKTLSKHDSEAIDFKASIIKYDDDSKSTYHTYRLQCGHEGKYPIASIRRKIAVCRDCRKERLIKEALDSGLEFVTPYCDIDPSSYNTYRFRKCGHIKDMVVTVAKDCPFCNECDDNKHAIAALASGFTVIKGEHKHCQRRTVCNTCGTERSIDNTTIMSGRSTCLVCRTNNAIDRQKIAAEKLGIELIAKDYEKSKDHYLFRLKCGHTRSIKNSSIYHGSIVCNICEASKVNLDFELYVFEISYNDFSFLKIGIATNSEFRSKTYGLVKGSTTRLLYKSNKFKYEDCLKYEQDIFKRFDEFRYHKNDLKSYISNGHTECFHASKQHQIIDYIESILIEKD